MQGAYVSYGRPKTKKEFKSAVAEHPELVRLEATSMMGNEFDGPILEMPEGKRMYIVGPDPYTRNWFANIIRTGERSFKIE